MGIYVRRESPDYLSILETDRTGVGEAVQNLLDGVEWLRDETIGSGAGRNVAAKEEGQLGSTRTVRNGNCTGKLNAGEWVVNAPVSS